MKLKSILPSGPYLFWMIVFIVFPLLLVIYFAFTDFNSHFSIANFAEIGKFMPVFGRSMMLGAIATVICLAMGYPLAFLMSRMSFAMQKFILMLIMLPMWMNFLLRTYAWMTLLENTGIINRFLGLFGLGPFNMINTSGAVVLGMVYNYLPFMILPLFSVMTKINNNLIEAAQDLGCGTIKVFTRVVIPLSVPGIMSGITMVFVPSVSTFIISKMLGGGSNLLIGDLVGMQFLGNANNPHLGSALSLILMVLILLSMALMNQFDSDDVSMEGMVM